MRTVEVRLGKLSINAEIADNFLKKAKGLMFRKNLPQNSGMLFIFNKEGHHPFWMMFTRIPLDIIWLDSDGKIVHIERNVKPSLVSFRNYGPKQKSKYVVETNGNITEMYGIKVGDKVELSI